MVKKCLIEAQTPVRGHPAEPADFHSILKDLVVGENGGQKERERSRRRGSPDSESVPSVPAQVTVALGCPGLIGAEQQPSRVVESGRSPAEVVAGMETPQTIQGNDRLLIRNEREFCGMRGGLTDVYSRSGRRLRQRRMPDQGNDT
jgi:hypothetical protein